MPTLSTTELTKLRHTLGRALAAADVNQLGRDTGQAERLRTVTPHRLFLAIATFAGIHASSAHGPEAIPFRSLFAATGHGNVAATNRVTNKRWRPPTPAV